MSRFLSPRHQTLSAYTPGEQPCVKLIKLNTNESPYPPSPKAVDALNPDAIQAFRLYSDIPARALTRAIGAFYGIDPDWVLCGNGSDEILAFAFMAFGEKGISFPDITYGFYPVWANLFGLTAKIVPVDGGFHIRLADYADGGLIVLANPNAPTGIALPVSEIEVLIRRNPDTVVLIDEAYVDFGAESCVKLIERYDNLIVVQTFSKSRSLAGARLGFAMAQPELIGDLNRMKCSFNPYNVGSPAQLMGAAAMNDRAYFQKTRQAIMDTRAWIKLALESLGFIVLPSSANFLFARRPDSSGVALWQALRERGILVRRFDMPRIRDHLRISIGTDEDMRALIGALTEILEAST